MLKTMIIKLCPNECIISPTGRGIIRVNNKTTKLRTEFNASEKAKWEHCLNGILHSGPCLLPYLSPSMKLILLWWGGLPLRSLNRVYLRGELNWASQFQPSGEQISSTVIISCRYQTSVPSNWNHRRPRWSSPFSLV